MPLYLKLKKKSIGMFDFWAKGLKKASTIPAEIPNKSSNPYYFPWKNSW